MDKREAKAILAAHLNEYRRRSHIELQALIEKHYRYTDSAVARKVLDNWEQSLRQFIKVMPTDYKRVLEERRTAVAAG